MTTVFVHSGQQRFRQRVIAFPPHYQVRPLPWIRRGVKAPALVLTVLPTWPQCVQVTVANLAIGQVVTVSRTQAGSTTATVVRGLNAVTTTADTLLKIDNEAPFGVLLTYTLTVNGVVLLSATTTLTLVGGKVALTDAITGDAAEVVVLAWPERRWERSSTVFPVAGRNIVVSGQTSGFTGTIDLFTETDDSKQNVLNLLRNSTSGIVQLRQAGPYDGVDAYISALSYSEQRYSQDGSDERRIISMEVVETGSWGSTLDASAFDLGDIADAYTGETLADFANDYLTLIDAALGDYS